MFRHFRFRFSLQALVATMVVSSVLLGLISIRVTAARRQANAVRLLTAAGAKVYYDFHRYRDDGGDWCINSERKAQNAQWLRAILGDDFFSHVYSVQFIGEHHFPPQYSFGPAPVATECSVNADEYIKCLAEIPNLVFLNLDNSHISDAAIPALAQLTSAKTIMLQNTNVTEESAEWLRKFLPGCEIYWHRGSGKPTDPQPNHQHGISKDE